MRLPVKLWITSHSHLCAISLIALLSIAPNAVMARGFYSVIDVGISSVKSDNGCSATPYFPWNGIYGVNCPSTASAMKLGIGFQFSPYFGIELDYGNWGNRSISGSWGGGTAVSGNEKLTAYQFNLFGIVPLSESWSVFGKFATADVKTEYRSNAPFNGSGSESVFGPGLGFGTQYEISKELAFRVQYETFALSTLYGGYGIALFSTGVMLKF